MNGPLWLLAPRRANRRATLWLALGVMLLASAAAAGIGTMSSKPDAWVGSVMMVAMGLGFTWAFVMSNTALLAIDARQLRLPYMSRAITISLWAYGLGSVLIPACVLSLWAGHLADMMLIMALACVGGLLFALLPRLLTVPLCFMPMLLQTFPLPLDVPGPGTAGFDQWALWMWLTVTLLAWLCWRRLAGAPNPYAQGLFRPLVLQLRRNACGGGWASFGRAVDNTRQIQRRPDWMQPQPSLRDCGPGRPRHSLRLAMGSPFMPLTPIGWMRQLGVMVVPGAVVCLLILMRDLQHAHALPLSAIWHEGGALALLWISVFTSMLMAFVCLMRVAQLWMKTNAELPLLALLPGLANADGHRARHDLLGALLWPALRIPLSLLLLSLGVLASIGAGMQTAMFVLLGQLGSIGFVLAIVPGIIGGRPLPTWAMMILGMYGCILINISLFVSTLGDPATIHWGPLPLNHLLLAGWTVLAATLCWLGRRGWQGLRQRPHPFLPN